jgi:hypothetical protein
VACTPCPPSENQDLRTRSRREAIVDYPHSPRLLDDILVPLAWVPLYVYLDNARYTEGILYSLQK